MGDIKSAREIAMEKLEKLGAAAVFRTGSHFDGIVSFIEDRVAR